MWASPISSRRSSYGRHSAELLLANNGGERDPGSIEALNDVAAEASLTVRFDPTESRCWRSRAPGTGAVLAPLVAIAYEAMVAGTWSRLKACPADDCHWAFYDHSKNRSGTWCAMRYAATAPRCGPIVSGAGAQAESS